jgi:hypothetical protein
LASSQLRALKEELFAPASEVGKMNSSLVLPSASTNKPIQENSSFQEIHDLLTFRENGVVEASVGPGDLCAMPCPACAVSNPLTCVCGKMVDAMEQKLGVSTTSNFEKIGAADCFQRDQQPDAC